jgi:hypothetical protein
VLTVTSGSLVNALGIMGLVILVVSAAPDLWDGKKRRPAWIDIPIDWFID